jgi:hypothetical protein
MKCSVTLRNDLADLIDEYQRKRLKIEVKTFQALPAKRPALEAKLATLKVSAELGMRAAHKKICDTYSKENGLEILD